MTSEGLARRGARWPELALAGLLLLFTLLVAAQGLRDSRRYPNLPVDADRFVWPQGCPPGAYSRQKFVPKRCAVHRHRIGDASQLGLPTTGRNTRWYRVGNDALLLACFRLGSDCRIQRSVPDKFIPARESRPLAVNRRSD